VLGGPHSPRVAPPSQPAVQPRGRSVPRLVYPDRSGGLGCQTIEDPAGCWGAALRSEAWHPWASPRLSLAGAQPAAGSWPCPWLGWDNPAGRRVPKSTRSIPWERGAWPWRAAAGGEPMGLGERCGGCEAAAWSRSACSSSRRLGGRLQAASPPAFPCCQSPSAGNYPENGCQSNFFSISCFARNPLSGINRAMLSGALSAVKSDALI